MECEPNNMKDEEGYTPLHRASMWGHLDIVMYLVTEGKCEPNRKEIYHGWTPLHMTYSGGHLDVMKYLLTETECEPNVKDKKGRTLLHKACRSGILDVVKLLVTEVNCDPNVKDNDGETPLHSASRWGNLEVVRYLITEGKSEPNMKDNIGFTPLHRASISNHKKVIEFLLEEAKCDPNITTMDGLTPLSLTSNTLTIQLLLKHGAMPAKLQEYSPFLKDAGPRKVAQSTISLFTVGDNGAGKSTLMKSLTKKKASIIRWTGRVGKVRDVKERTAGIESHTVHDDRLGHIQIYDMAGHREFHNSHDTVIRSSMSHLAMGIFVFVLNLTSFIVDLKGTVSYWLSFIQSQISSESSEPAAKPFLIAVGSHADLVEPKQALEDKESIVRNMCEDAENIDFIDYVRVDCHYSESSSLTKLRSHILATHDKLQERIPRMMINEHCFHVYIVTKCGSKPGLQLSKLMSTILADPLSRKEKFLPLTIEALHEACSNLNRRGAMLYIQTKSIESSWIIINRDVLLQEVNGSVFSPANFTEYKSLTLTGVVPFSKIDSSFPQLDPQLIIDFLVHMEFCRQMTVEDGLKLVIATHPEYSKEPYFLFPGLTPLDPPSDLWLPNPLINYSHYSSCWILQCNGHQHYLSSRMQQILLLRLAFTHAFPLEKDKMITASPSLQQECTIWRRGIKWTTRSSVDTLVEINDKAVVVIQRCGQGREMQLVELRSRVMAEVQSVKMEFCNNAVAEEMFLTSPKYPVDTQSSVSLYKLSHAIFSQEDSVLIDPHTPLSITGILFFEPYSFCSQQCLVDLYSKDNNFCTVNSPFIQSVSCKITNNPSSSSQVITYFCCLLNVSFQRFAAEKNSGDYEKAVIMFAEWKTGTQGTYQCLRQQMDKYSIFSRRNLLEIAKISLDCLPSTSHLTSSLDTHQAASIEFKKVLGKEDRVNMINLASFQSSSGSINIIHKVGPDYKPLLVNILLKSEDGQRIRALEMTHYGTVDQIVYAMFQQWCMEDEECTWGALVFHLKQSKLITLATLIESSLL